jgi:purine nucleosidase
MERRKILLDADVGIDDAIAMLHLAGRSDVELLAVGSVHGNIPSDLAAVNARRLLELCGLDDVPVAYGARRPMAQPLATAEWVHGEDGLGNTNQPAPKRGPGTEDAVSQILRLTREMPGEIDLLAVGPLTNLGLALCLDPELAGRVRSVVVMGGAIAHEGNASATAEANIWHDPEAANLVFGAEWPVTMVGLDVTQVTRLRTKELEAIEAIGSVRSKYALKVLSHYLDAYQRSFGERECPLHDPLAAGIVADPTYMTEWLDRAVEVNTTGPTRGATIIDRRVWMAPAADARETRERNGGKDATPPLVRVPMKVDGPRFVADLIASLK